MRETIERLEQLVQEQSKQLQRREKDLRAILDNMPAMIGYWDTDLRNRFGNRAYVEWFGIDHEKMPGMHIRDVIGEERFRLNTPYMEAALRGERQTFERDIPTPDGSAIRSSLAEYIPDIQDGKVEGFFVLVSDVTPLKQAEAKLATSENHLRTVIDSEPECIKMVDAQGTLLEINPAGLAMLEADRAAQIVGLNVLDFVAPEYRHAFWAMHQQIMAGESQKLEYETIGLNGKRRWMESHAVPFEYHGRRVHLAVTRDATARKAAETALQRSNADLEHFAYAASHDLRQPLRMVSSYLGLLDKSLTGRLSEEEGTYLNFAVAGAKRMNQMITDLLAYSRLCQDAPNKQAVNLNDALQRALDSLQMNLIETEAEITAAALPTILGIDSEFERLFQNLVGNAVKFQRPGCRPVIAIDCREEGDEWIISISDNGIGIAADDCGRLFKVFQRLVGNDQYQGSGIGLAACRKIVEHHDGRIWINSQTNPGASFLFAIPKM